MYEELIKALRGCVLSKPCELCPFYDPNGPSEKCATMNIAAADAIEELQQMVEQYKVYLQDAINDLHSAHEKEPKWISVTERLPVEKDHYLTVSIDPWFGTTVVDIMRWSGVWMYDGRQTEAKVTHWMPLPEPPPGEG